MDGSFDAIILGTGLTESITAAALSKAGFKIAHIDTNPYYGADDASLSLDELIQWANEHSSRIPDPEATVSPSRKSDRFTSISRSEHIPTQSRQYSLSLSPSVIPSVGPLLSSLVSSGVARYGGYRLLERVGVYDQTGTLKNVPGSKEDVFKNKRISLVDKRRLMRFLMFAVGDFEGKKELEGKERMPFIGFIKTVFSLTDDMAVTIVYALAYCNSAADPTLPALQRIRRYLRSTGRYGSSSFLVGHYGGSGEIAQGFCRTAAVSGGVYILGRRILSITQANDQGDASSGYTIKLEDVPDLLTCDLIIATRDYVPSHLSGQAKFLHPSWVDDGQRNYPVARCIAITEQPVLFPSGASSPDNSSDPEATPSEVPPASSQLDTSVIVFPPSSVPGGSVDMSVTALITGEGSMSAPKGKWIIYLSLPLREQTTSSPESLLKPYLDVVLSLTVSPPSETASSNVSPEEPLFNIFYTEHPPSKIPMFTADESSTLLVTPPPTSKLADFSDAAATNAEAVFWEAVTVLKSSQRVISRRRLEREEASGDVFGDVENFWPLVEGITDDDADEDW